jgi:S1-C subfamily serine protease
MSDESQVPSRGGDTLSTSGEGASAEKLPVLCRETVLPKERGRGMAGVAVVCSMAGVASGLALAATLMAVQIADRSPREARVGCSFANRATVSEDPRGWLGVEFVLRYDGAHVLRVFSGTAAEQAGLQRGDVIRAVNNEPLDRPSELQYLVRSSGAGSQPSLLVERDGEQMVVRPILSSFPAVIHY